MAQKKVKILVVEDEAFLLDLYETRLEQEGYEVIKANNGAEGLSLAQLELPKLILLDILMPQVDGYEMLGSLKQGEKTKNIPVIIFSNLSQREEIEKGLELGANDFIIKTSVTPSEMVDKVKSFLKRNK
ncbi:MAG: response regulator [Patescibacteria group bacterium]|jgi:DNA-binding response OmpR family regulator|nr:response regulator [Patescibacteria group bacterium]